MKPTTSLLWLTAALGANAHPSAHHHLHRAFHEKRDAVFYKAEHKAPLPPAATTTTTTAPPPPSSTPAASSSAAATPSSSSSGTYKPFCGGKKKRATAAEISYTGNTGAQAGDWGCNIMLIDDDIADQYKYTSVYTNAGSEEHQVVCFNKIGPTGLIDGFFHSAVTFSLAPGQSQTIAFDDNSQGACAFAPGEVEKTSFGEYAGSWVEFDFGNESNGAWSGADCSALVAMSAGLSVPGCQVCHDGTCSTIYPGGRAVNAYIKGMEAVDGTGLNISPGQVQLQVKVGYSG
ncbi:hypothetical protein VTK73DRAFT_8015 [Phialemonium thermophilum]|uniref:Allergen Asp f 4 n=1 Tax=Phialemonium thermophilum TaxID=223376 RepID=A0ABR3XQY1_9PEZI